MNTHAHTHAYMHRCACVSVFVVNYLQFALCAMEGVSFPVWCWNRIKVLG